MSYSSKGNHRITLARRLDKSLRHICEHIPRSCSALTPEAVTSFTEKEDMSALRGRCLLIGRQELDVEALAGAVSAWPDARGVEEGIDGAQHGTHASQQHHDEHQV